MLTADTVSLLVSASAAQYPIASLSAAATSTLLLVLVGSGVTAPRPRTVCAAGLPLLVVPFGPPPLPLCSSATAGLLDCAIETSPLPHYAAGMPPLSSSAA